MENYDNIAQDLKETIDKYKRNLESLKERFADIGNIIHHLDQLKQQTQCTESKGEELFSKIADLDLKHADLSEKMTELSSNYESTLNNLRVQHNEWSKAVDGVVRDISFSISDLKSDYNARLDKALAEIALQADKEAASLDQFLQQFSRIQVTEIERVKQELSSNLIQSLGDSSTQLLNLTRELHDTSEDHLERVNTCLNDKIDSHARLLEQKMESVELMSTQKIEELRNSVTLDMNTIRKTIIAGIIIMLAFLIGLVVHVIVF